MCVCVFLYDAVFHAFSSSGTVRVSVSSSNALSVLIAISIEPHKGCIDVSNPQKKN